MTTAIPANRPDIVGDGGQTSGPDPALAAIARWKQEMRARAVEYFDGLKAQGVAPVRHHGVKGRSFIDLSIEGQRFKGQVRKGPVIVSDDADCLLTSASIAYCADYMQPQGRRRWAVCNYRTQHRILLDCLSPDGIRALACEFGLVIHDQGESETLSESECFVSSRACDGLHVWVRNNPSLASKLLRDHPDFLRDLAAGTRAPRKSRYRNVHEFEYFTGS
jgi:hypothetical protein